MTENQDYTTALGILTEFNNKELANGVTEEEIKRIATCAKEWCEQVEAVEHISVELVEKILLLALYDVVLLLDDSGSMRREESGKRIQEMQAVAHSILRVNMIFRKADEQIVDRGVYIRLLNGEKKIRVDTIEQFDREYGAIRFSGWTKLGGMLRSKIIEPEVRDIIVKDKNIRRQRPLLISIITDGNPEGEDRQQLKKELQSCIGYVRSHQDLGKRAVVFQISQVGNDAGAQKFLHELETDEELKDVVDVTSNADLERARTGQGRLTISDAERPIKMLAGALLVDFDSYHKEEWSI